jgi:oxalate decarboxylase/phosphoglucose isomerase-like protein (cupin superfamily)
MCQTGDATKFPFKNNIPDPLLSGKELPTFKFALEQSQGKVLGGSYGKEATVEELPISKGIAGVSMRLEPGVTRELHWRATAAEWAFVLEGRVRTTLVDPRGSSEINDFDPGDVWYFPRGNPHSLACLGEKACHFILIFDNGYFSEFGTFSITDWLGHASKSLLAKNFGLPEATFDGDRFLLFRRSNLAKSRLRKTHRLRPPGVADKCRRVLYLSVDYDHDVVAHVGRPVPACSATMYSAYQSGQFGSALPMRFSCSPWAASARRSALAKSLADAKVVVAGLMRPGRRAVTSCSSQLLPSGSLNVANEP